MSTAEHKDIKVAENWLANNLHEVATVTEWAQQFGYRNINSFRTVFWKEFNKLPSDVFRELRMRKAKKLLRESNLTYREIAQKICLPSGKALYKYFKYHIGKRPSFYRK